MFTTGSKLLFGIALAAIAAGLGIVVLTMLGIRPMEFSAAIVLITAGLAAAMVGGVVVAFRDADVQVPAGVASSSADAEGALLGSPRLPSPSPWPIVAAFGLGLLLTGLIVSHWLVIAGALVLLAVLVEWMVQAWSDRASEDPAYNRRLRDSIMFPFEFPLAGLLIAAVVVIGFSRVLLAVSKEGSTILFIVLGALVLAVAVVIAGRSRIPSGVTAGVLLAGGVAIIAGGVAGAAVGERKFHDIGEDPVNELEAASSVSNRARPVVAVVVRDDGFFFEAGDELRPLDELRIQRAVPMSMLVRFEDVEDEANLRIRGPLGTEAEGQETTGEVADDEPATEEGQAGGTDEQSTLGGSGESGDAVDLATRPGDDGDELFLQVRLLRPGAYEVTNDFDPDARAEIRTLG